nr:ATP-binding protein [uncultured Deefgea sp.]
MADMLIKHLNEKGSAHSGLSLLVNQWGFDEKLIPKALQTIGGLFPHYSRHDESHSKQILINIERLLGENIKLLTATDTWLLLEAAYWHDIGMVVPQEDIANTLKLAEFQQYLDSICNTPNHELERCARNLRTRNDSNSFFDARSPLEAVGQFGQLMAEWFRRQHAGRAAKTIQSPWDSAGISSPRTELIPARLFKLLGRICQMHGSPFEELLAPNGLPFREAGLAQEDCHPRFIACLLRMGDLLDLDDNRFCPVMQRIAGENRPKLSKAHEDKHAGLRHLRIDRERIEISAECETIDGYLETFKWFDWLKQEVQNQMVNWQDIVPSRDLGLLPTLGSLKVRLSGELQILKEGQRPQFGVDGVKAIELLQGNNLYSTKFSCIRELLQNAVDATLLRLWLSKSKRKSDTAEVWDSPLAEGARVALDSALVEVSLTETPEPNEDMTDKSTWTLTITDEGTGISREDLAYMLQIGGSHRNQQRQAKISAMPEWMKPSGTFGIGLQSVFLLCNEITLTTKSIFSNEILQITMHSPTGPHEGLVLLKILENDIGRSFGTEIKAKFQLDAFAKSWTISLGGNISLAEKFVNAMDPLDASFPYEAAKIADEFIAFSANSPIKIVPKLITSNGKQHIDVTAKVPISNVSNQWRFVNVNSHALALRYTPVVYGRSNWSLSLLYRGQPFEFKNKVYSHLQLEVDLMSGKAGHWLIANREKLAGSAEGELNKLILAALEQQVRSDIAAPEDIEMLHENNRPTYSFFLEVMALSHQGGWKELAQLFDKEWLALPCRSKIYPTFHDAFLAHSWTLGEAPSRGEPEVLGCDVLVDSPSWDATLHIVLNEWLKDDRRTVQVQVPELREESAVGCSEGDIPTTYLEDAVKYRVRYLLKKEKQEAYTNDALATRLAAVARQTSGNSRYLLNVDDIRWNKLWLKDDAQVMAQRLFDVTPRNAKFILLPFLFRGLVRGVGVSSEATSEQLDALCKWIQPNLVSTVTLEEIRETYKKLIEYLDVDVMGPSIHSARWRTSRGLSD